MIEARTGMANFLTVRLRRSRARSSGLTDERNNARRPARPDLFDLICST
jgi:hypothetical protein